ncbi:hypothetical protein SARC_06054 [Sphaeroforma arctica JP610]|uniref:Uncharacterized protein n=1 Tax=Sphaeroforma arctica JP610 TaxID=667725 RepID=A0A0L0FYK7_9EUKA|nr:hypothetical protein SARC_06054 [Sphaeroforma arctica JP610]KNC81631.1 hypothetical protein SARC_06054 [Sphaeroforma arctica JP610]|eukprot:XP_014155533.1 hypothetical protein SARC_06054 [Sphaeroforma arctica JP610]
MSADDLRVSAGSARRSLGFWWMKVWASLSICFRRDRDGVNGSWGSRGCIVVRNKGSKTLVGKRHQGDLRVVKLNGGERQKADVRVVKLNGGERQKEDARVVKSNGGGRHQRDVRVVKLNNSVVSQEKRRLLSPETVYAHVLVQDAPTCCA